MLTIEAAEVGIAALESPADRRTFFHSDALASLQSAGNSATAELLRTMQGVFAQACASADLSQAAALHYLGRVVLAQAYSMGFRDSILVVAIVFALALIPALIMGMGKAVRAGEREGVRVGKDQGREMVRSQAVT